RPSVIFVIRRPSLTNELFRTPRVRAAIAAFFVAAQALVVLLLGDAPAGAECGAQLIAERLGLILGLTAPARREPDQRDAPDEREARHASYPLRHFLSLHFKPSANTPKCAPFPELMHFFESAPRAPPCRRPPPARTCEPRRSRAPWHAPRALREGGLQRMPC